MNQLTPQVFLDIETVNQEYEFPFERYFPIYRPGVSSKWLESTLKKGGWVIEPFGSSPQSLFEIALSGYKVLAAVNNPIIAFVLRTLSTAPDYRDFQSIIAEISTQKRGTERLESHLRGLYLTKCASCGEHVSARAFIWNRGEQAPFARIYDCPKCGDSGEHPVDPEDISRLEAIQRSEPLHRARALEKASPTTKETRQSVEEALDLYSPRALYCLFTLMNKVEGLTFSPERKILVEALLLSALDSGHSLWSWPEVNERPRLLNIPAQYIEKNIWMELEKAASQWSGLHQKVNITTYPDVPSENGICVYNGRLRDLLKHPPETPPEKILSTFPRPNPAFWVLSTLWSSWLWGTDKTSTFRNVLDRRRFDWYWHTTALQSALSASSLLVSEQTQAFGILTEVNPGFVNSVIEAGASGGFSIQGCALDESSAEAQLLWTTSRKSREIKHTNMQRIAHEAIREVINNAAEPQKYLTLHMAVMLRLAQQSALPLSLPLLTSEVASEIQSDIAGVFADKKFLQRLDATSQELESGWWWLTQPDLRQLSLVDRVETEVITILQKHKIIKEELLVSKIRQRFTSLSTPSEEVIRECALSYADNSVETGEWNLREKEYSVNRKHDVQKISGYLKKASDRLGFVTNEENPTLWTDPVTQETRYRVLLGASAGMSRYVINDLKTDIETVLVFPASRSALIRYKLDRDPWLREQVKNWHFLKFRSIRSIADRKDLSRDMWDLMIDSDPISLEETTQLSMFN